MDGTLTVPVFNFSVLRERLQRFKLCPGDILGSVEEQENAEDKQEMLRIIEEFEAEGRERFALQPDINEMLEVFHESQIKMAIITRNDKRAVEQFLKHLKPHFQDGKIFSHVSVSIYTTPSSLALTPNSHFSFHPRNPDFRVWHCCT